MSWTTVFDVSFQGQSNNIITDSSRFHNDAENISNIKFFNNYANFDNPDDRIIIPIKNNSLQEFKGLKIECNIYPILNNNRFNLVEGLMSFAFFIEADKKLMATIYDGNNWVNVKSSEDIPTNQWSKVSFQYDGISIGKLVLNGNVIGINCNMPTGMLQPQTIIAIGHWPNGDNRYTYQGKIKTVKIKRRNIEDIAYDQYKFLFCKKTHLNYEQSLALKEIFLILDSLDEKTKKEINNWASKHSDKILQLINTLRQGSMRNIAIHRDFVRVVSKIWCEERNTDGIKHSIEYLFNNMFDKNNSSEYQQLEKIITDCLEIILTDCIDNEILKKIEQLFYIVIPEISDLNNNELEKLLKHILVV